MTIRARLPAVAEADLTERQRAVLKPFHQAKIPNILATLVRAPEALEAAGPWLRYTLTQSSLIARHREMIILRIGTLTSADYEISVHQSRAIAAGLNADEVTALITDAPSAWGADEAAIVSMCNDIAATYTVSDETWAALRQAFDETSVMDAVFTAAQYVQIAILLRSFGVELDVEDNP